MKLCVKTSPTLNGTLTPPSSKSQTIRGMLFAMLAKGHSSLHNILDSDDANSAALLCRDLGVHITEQAQTLILNSMDALLSSTKPLYSGNSGISTRFILPILGLRNNTHVPIILDCGAQMRARPIHSLVNALRNLGMTLEYLESENQLPLSVSGNLIGGSTEVDGMTSQYISALLISLPLAQRDSEIILDHLNERPYVEMTLEWLNKQHIVYSHQQIGTRDIFHIQGGQHYRPFDITIPSDFSSASYLIAAAALTNGQITLQGLNMQDAQGDKALIPILQRMGADIHISQDSITIQGGKPLIGIEIDCNAVPDLLPTLAVIGTQAKGKTVLYNVPQARIKETDRIHSMTEGLSRLGGKLTEQEDGMTIEQSHLRGTMVKGYDDHRTVMALSIAGLLAENETHITHGNAINKTYPDFIKHMTTLGAQMELCHE